MKRVIIIRSNPIEPDSRVEKEANSLSKAGYDVQLIAWDRTNNYLIKKNYKKLADCKVQRIQFGAKAKYGVGMKSLFSYCRFQLSLFFWLIKNRNDYDLCHLCDFDTAFTGSIVCKITGKKYIFDIFDYLSTDVYSKRAKIVEALENNIINTATATIICTEQRAQQIKKSAPRNLTVIHNSPEKIQFVEKEEVNRSTRIKIAYVGILQEFRLIQEMIQIIGQTVDVELHIGGFGKLEDYVKKSANKYDNIYYYGKMQYKQTLELEQNCDILTAIYDPALENHIFAAPNKFYEALFLGKPLIMVKNTGMSEVVEKQNIGVLIEYSAQGFQEGLKALIARKDEWQDMKKKMQCLYKEKYSWKIMETRLLGLYSII